MPLTVLAVCGGKEEAFQHYSDILPDLQCIQCLKTNLKRLLFPSSEDYSATREREHDGSESLLRCYIRAEIFLSR